MSDLPALADALGPATPTDLALFLDVDGTLLEFSDAPDKVDVPAPLLDTLRIVHERLGGAMALVTGRTLEDLDRLFQPLRLPGAGLHGFEIRGADDGHARHDTDSAAIAEEKRNLHRIFETAPGILIEDKGPCIAVHFRRAPDMEAAVGDAVGAARDRLGPTFEMLEGHMVRELRPAGIDKGHAVRQLMAMPPFAGRHPVFIGDDVTDEDGFEAVNDLRGLSVCVGSRRPTKAAASLTDVAAVHAWLGKIAGADTDLSPSIGKETMQA